MECGAIQDILETCGVITAAENQKAKREMLIRIVSMLTKLGKRNYRVEERSVPYHSLDHDNDINLNSDNDHDNDHDNDNECGMSQDLLSVRAER